MNETRSVESLFDLSGQVAVVTGAPGQLGRVISEALAEQGAHVVAVSRTEEKCEELAESLTERYQYSIAVPTDVTDPDQVEALSKAVEEEFGSVDVLVNNAYSGDVVRFEEMSAESFRTGIEGALTSTFLTTQGLLSLLRTGGASIINVASIYGIVAPDHRIYGDTGLNNPVNYSSAKAGVIQFSRWVATRYATEGIRANSLIPGGIYNPDLERMTDYQDVFVPNYEDRTPMSRMGNPEDLKGPTVFLASEASQWMTGQKLVVDGGLTIW